MRWFALTVIGCFALYGAWHLHVTPLAPHAPERNGWLFQQFGQQGVALGTLLMAIVFIFIGLIGMVRQVRRVTGRREARMLAASPQTASHHPLVENESGGQGGVRAAFSGLILLVAGGAMAYFGLYLPLLTDRPPNMKASFGVPVAIGYGLALLLLGQEFGPRMYRRKDGIYMPTVLGAITLVVLLSLGLSLGLGLDWWITERLHARH
jgi:hypothetical protein